MYTVTVIRKDQEPQRTPCVTGGDLRNAIYPVVRAEWGDISDGYHRGLITAISDARSMADIEGFAALEFGTAAITIRPHTA